jgi:SAM-dependent methyltransferase
LVGGFVEMYLAGRVAVMTMLDPCSAMLDKCRRRAELFSFPCEFRSGDIHSLPETDRFDVITINSVLHHIVELPAFFARLEQHLTPQGWLLLAHDPRAEALLDPEFQARRRQWRKAGRDLCRSAWTRLRRLVRGTLGHPEMSPLAVETSTRLLEKRAIRRPMPMASIYSVTDFHVPGQPGSFGKGIALAKLKEWLSGLTLSESFTYQYHGAPWASLNREQQAREREWWAARDPHGELMASAWQRNLQG